jgi:hypothetical protein
MQNSCPEKNNVHASEKAFSNRNCAHTNKLNKHTCTHTGGQSSCVAVFFFMGLLRMVVFLLTCAEPPPQREASDHGIVVPAVLRLDKCK